MGLMSNTASISQFRVIEGQLPPSEERYEWLKEILQRYRFIDIRDRADEISVGFVELQDHARSEFDNPGAVWIGDYICFTIRQDVRRVPAAILNETLRERTDEWLQEHPGMQRVPKSLREDMKEAVRGQLLAKTLPSPATFDVSWNTATGIVTLASTGRKGIDLLTDIFPRAFSGFRLRAITPYDRALQIATAFGMDEAMEKANLAGSEAVMDLIASNKWLGQDFLLWLLHAGMNGSTDGDQRYWIDTKIVLHQASEDGHQTVSIAGPQHRLPEVKAAIRDGKKITDATIYLEDCEDTWRMTLKGDTFFFCSFKCPAVTLERDDLTDQANEQQAVFLERMHLLEKGQHLLEQAMERFLRDRLTEEWIDVLQGIHEWLEE